MIDEAVALVDLGRYSLSKKEMEIRISCQINDEHILIRMEVELTEQDVKAVLYMIAFMFANR